MFFALDPRLRELQSLKGPEFTENLSSIDSPCNLIGGRQYGFIFFRVRKSGVFTVAMLLSLENNGLVCGAVYHFSLVIAY
jgi:hypothetical protein